MLTYTIQVIFRESRNWKIVMEIWELKIAMRSITANLSSDFYCPLRISIFYF